MRTLLFGILLGSVAISHQGTFRPTYTDKDINKIVIPACLAETGLNLSILGVARVEDVRETSFDNLKTLTEDKRGCFIACAYKMLGIITEKDTLRDDPPRAHPQKKFATTFEDAIKACRGETDLCKLGGCLYGIYFL